MVDLSEKDLNDVHETFLLFDSKGDEKISAKDVSEVVRALGLNPTESDISKYGYQNHPNERISFESFVPIYQGLSKEQLEVEPEAFIESFRVFDKDDNGLISAAELRHLLTAFGEKLRDDEVDILLSGLENSQGLVPYEAFVRRVIS
ncbi:unnamed protein product [Heterobilharzia americana]|nr:unnamed protein product [Heterobilharzia americana]CAH8522375.1 unnamed protein product [Heterobilharzia americana]CAH8522392.1 unnamed protein product [Heterobilharzia americana]